MTRHHDDHPLRGGRHRRRTGARRSGAASRAPAARQHSSASRSRSRPSARCGSPRRSRPSRGRACATRSSSAPTAQRGDPGVTLIPEPIGPRRVDAERERLHAGAGRRRMPPLPVLVWIHGGGYFAGSPASPWYDGASFNRDGVVTVSISYRLGFDGFGWIADAPSNRGVRDWLLALQWVQDNIANFGGDPSRVTIAGQSAGGGAVLTLLGMPAAQHLFHSVWALSGATADVAHRSLGDARTRHRRAAPASLPRARRCRPCREEAPHRGAEGGDRGDRPRRLHEAARRRAAARPVDRRRSHHAPDDRRRSRRASAPTSRSCSARPTTSSRWSWRGRRRRSAGSRWACCSAGRGSRARSARRTSRRTAMSWRAGTPPSLGRYITDRMFKTARGADGTGARRRSDVGVPLRLPLDPARHGPRRGGALHRRAVLVRLPRLRADRAARPALTRRRRSPTRRTPPRSASSSAATRAGPRGRPPRARRVCSAAPPAPRTSTPTATPRWLRCSDLRSHFLPLGHHPHARI